MKTFQNVFIQTHLWKGIWYIPVLFCYIHCIVFAALVMIRTTDEPTKIAVGTLMLLFAGALHYMAYEAMRDIRLYNAGGHRSLSSKKERLAFAMVCIFSPISYFYFFLIGFKYRTLG